MTQTVTILQAFRYGFHKSSAADEAIRHYVLMNCGCARKVYNCMTGDLYDFLEKHGYEKGDDIPEFPVPGVTAYKNREKYRGTGAYKYR